MSVDEKEVKPSIPTKSSLEILSELFSTFHAEPPLIIKKEKTDSVSKKHKKKKKHKHKERKHKKKDKKRKRHCENYSEDEAEVNLADIFIKQEGNDLEKKIKIEGTDLEVDIKLEHVKKEQNEAPEDHKSKKDLKEIKASLENTDGEITDSDSSKEHLSVKKHEHRKRSRSSSRSKETKKSKIDDLRSRLNTINRRRKHSRDRSGDRYSEKNSKHKSSKDDFYKGYRDRSRSRDRDKYRERHRDSDDYVRNRATDEFYKFRDREDRSDKWHFRDRYRGYSEREYRRRSGSRDRDSSNKIDKKKLLEIARKNAITMMKSGSLPAALTLGPQAQEKVIAAIKSGGKTIEELTDFCKTLSKKEELGELSSLSDGGDSDSDNDRPFHHPFQIKDRPTSITMNIKNSVPLPLKTVVERNSELRMQFPVSSGQQHRKGEEWLPVSPIVPKKDEEKAVSGPVVSKIPLPVPNAPLAIEPPPPTSCIPLPQQMPVASLPQITTSMVPVTNNVVYPGPQLQSIGATEPVDISSIVSQRLTAMRKLQENPNDVQALSKMYQINKEMQSWAASKQQLGQFTGSTGAQILTQAELSSGYQAWAKKDQLQCAAPVSGGMGMHLLQKMGWKPGEGLGKEKTGALEPLLLEVKLDKKGLVANEEQQKGRKQKQRGGGVVPAAKTLQSKHPVSLLGEYASKKKLGAPQYILEFECGPDHKKNFLFKVLLNGVEYKPSVASNNKKEAKAAAATVCLQQIGLLIP